MYLTLLIQDIRKKVPGLLHYCYLPFLITLSCQLSVTFLLFLPFQLSDLHNCMFRLRKI
jgi:hypothetical protein